MALGLRLQDSDGFAFDEEQVVGEPEASGELELPNGDAPAGAEVGLISALDDPSGIAEELVDQFASDLLRTATSWRRQGRNLTGKTEGMPWALPTT